LVPLRVVGVGVTLAWAAFRPGEVYGNPPPDPVHVDNPFGLQSASWLFPPLAWIGGITVLLAALMGVGRGQPFVALTSSVDGRDLGEAMASR